MALHDVKQAIAHKADSQYRQCNLFYSAYWEKNEQTAGLKTIDYIVIIHHCENLKPTFPRQKEKEDDGGSEKAAAWRARMEKSGDWLQLPEAESCHLPWS